VPEPLTIKELRYELAEHFRHRPGIEPVFRSALVWLCTTTRPTRTRQGLARKAEISETTLWRHERQAFPNGPTLHELLHFLALIADLQAYFATTTRSAKSTKEVRERALQAFGVFPLDEAQALLLAREWVTKHLG
jgi:hypothetical protein